MATETRFYRGGNPAMGQSPRRAQLGVDPPPQPHDHHHIMIIIITPSSTRHDHHRFRGTLIRIHIRPSHHIHRLCRTVRPTNSMLSSLSRSGSDANVPIGTLASTSTASTTSVATSGGGAGSQMTPYMPCPTVLPQTWLARGHGSPRRAHQLIVTAPGRPASSSSSRVCD
jgi:hypothetical protein